MRQVFCVIPLLAMLGCAHHKDEGTAASSQPTPQMTSERTASPHQLEAQNQKICSSDPDCGDKQLCVRMSCLDINADLAECGNARVHFDTDSAVIGTDDLRKLDRVARCLKADQTLRVTIEGNADQRGGVAYNVELGDKRATAVANYLASKGVSDTQLRTVSYGAENPLCVDQDQDCYAKNRRAAVKVKSKDTASLKRNKQM